GTAGAPRGGGGGAWGAPSGARGPGGGGGGPPAAAAPRPRLPPALGAYTPKTGFFCSSSAMTLFSRPRCACPAANPSASNAIAVAAAIVCVRILPPAARSYHGI